MDVIYFSNLPKERANTIAEDLGATGPVRISEVEKCQNRIIDMARNAGECKKRGLR